MEASEHKQQKRNAAIPNCVEVLSVFPPPISAKKAGVLIIISIEYKAAFLAACNFQGKKTDPCEDTNGADIVPNSDRSFVRNGEQCSPVGFNLEGSNP